MQREKDMFGGPATPASTARAEQPGEVRVAPASVLTLLATMPSAPDRSMLPAAWARRMPVAVAW